MHFDQPRLSFLFFVLSLLTLLCIIRFNSANKPFVLDEGGTYLPPTVPAGAIHTAQRIFVGFLLFGSPFCFVLLLFVTFVNFGALQIGYGDRDHADSTPPHSNPFVLADIWYPYPGLVHFLRPFLGATLRPITSGPFRPT